MTRHHLALTCAAVLLAACSAPAPGTQQSPNSADYAPNYIDAPLDLSTPESTAYSLMIAMYRGDAEMVDAVFAEGGTLLRLRPDGSLTRDGLPRWRDWVSTLELGYAHEELFDIEVQRFGKLATVWAPFVIDVDSKRVGCGVNQFTMAEMEGDWRIITGMDVQAAKEECSGFRDGYARLHPSNRHPRP